MSQFGVAGIQMRISAFQSNLDHIKSKINALMSIYPWVNMVMLSELAIFGPLVKFAQTLPGEAEEELKKVAERHKIWLITGSMFEKVEDKIYNTSSVINPNGEVIGRYRKLFPFYPYEEQVSSGNEFLVFEVPQVGKFGVSICYDMWFPETTRTLAAMGAEVILHATLTNSIDRDLELSIARTTAGINQCYMFDINGLGDGGNGRSIVCGPDGDIIYQAGTIEELIPIPIDLERVRQSRKNGILGLGQTLKSFRDRKVHFDIYDPNFKSTYLASLGKLEKPKQGFRD